MIYEIIFHKKTEKFLLKQPRNSMLRILQAIGKLPDGDVKKMEGYTNLYRLRVGDYRILFEKTEKSNEIILLDITNIDSRGQIYKNK